MEISSEWKSTLFLSLAIYFLQKWKYLKSDLNDFSYITPAEPPEKAGISPNWGGFLQNSSKGVGIIRVTGIKQ